MTSAHYIELPLRTSLKALLTLALTDGPEDADIERHVEAALRDGTALIAFEEIDGQLHMILAWDNEKPPYQLEAEAAAEAAEGEGEEQGEEP